MNEVRLIDANALIEEFKKHEDRNGYLKADWEVLIGNAPTVLTYTEEDMCNATSGGYER